MYYVGGTVVGYRAGDTVRYGSWRTDCNSKEIVARNSNETYENDGLVNIWTWVKRLSRICTASVRGVAPSPSAVGAVVANSLVLTMPN